MLDGFVSGHSHVMILGEYARLQDSTFEEIKTLCRNASRLPPLSLEVFQTFLAARTQELHANLHIERCLIDAGLVARSRADRLLIEIVLLHLLKEQHAKSQTRVPEAGRAVALLGSMIQERLTELLLGLDPWQRTRVFGLGKLWALSKTAWENEFRGATAAVRTIRAFHAIDNVTLRLPTIEEDLDQGIDLFVEVLPLPVTGLQVPLHLAVSVKSVNRPERMNAEHLMNGTTSDANGSLDQQQRIIRGAHAATARYDRRFIPVRVMVGRPEDVNYELRVEDEEIAVLERLIGQIEKALRPRRSAPHLST